MFVLWPFSLLSGQTECRFLRNTTNVLSPISSIDGVRPRAEHGPDTFRGQTARLQTDREPPGVRGGAASECTTYRRAGQEHRALQTGSLEAPASACLMAGRAARRDSCPQRAAIGRPPEAPPPSTPAPIHTYTH